MNKTQARTIIRLARTHSLRGVATRVSEIFPAAGFPEFADVCAGNQASGQELVEKARKILSGGD